MMANLERTNPIEVSLFTHSFSLTDAYPKIEATLRIFLTIPVTVSTCEELSVNLKKYLRSTMAQERLSGQAIILIDN